MFDTKRKLGFRRVWLLERRVSFSSRKSRQAIGLKRCLSQSLLVGGFSLAGDGLVNRPPENIGESVKEESFSERIDPAVKEFAADSQS